MEPFEKLKDRLNDALGQIDSSLQNSENDNSLENLISENSALQRQIDLLKIELENLSNANDTILLKNLLRSKSKNIWDAEDAGTSMRFLTSFLAITNQGVLLTGTERMKKRPIKILVDALNKIGAEISYEEKDGYPPLTINKKISQVEDSISIRGDISSQYISSLLMIAPILPSGLKIKIIPPFYLSLIHI